MRSVLLEVGVSYKKLELVLYAIVVVISVGLGIWSERLDFRLQTQTKTENIAKINQSIASGLSAEISELVARANGMAAVVALNPDIGPVEFSAAAARLSVGTSIVQNISLATDNIVRRVYPENRNSELLGLDYRNLPDQFQGVLDSEHAAEPIFLGPVDLVQGGRGFILRLSFARHANEDAQLGPRDMISIVVDARSFFSAVDLAVESSDIATLIIRPEDGTVIYGSPSVLQKHPVATDLVTPSNAWRVASAPASGWPQLSTNAPVFTGIAIFRMAIVIVVLRSIFGLLRKRRLAEDRLIAAIEALDAAFVLFDSNGRLLMSNSRYREIYATSADLLVPGATFEEIIRGGVARGQYADAIGREEAWIRERLAVHYSGQQITEQKLDNGRWVKVAERKTDDGSIVGFRVDITELKQATDDALAADRAKSNFISVLSHELRTPLTIVIGYVRLVASIGKLPLVSGLRKALEVDASPEIVAQFEMLVATTEEMAAKGHKSAQHLLALINHLLDFSKIAAGKTQLEVSDVSVEAILNEIGEPFREIVETKGLSFDVSSQSMHVRADPVRLKQILINLLSNAVKFTEKGGVGVETLLSGDKVLFRVHDTGSGISAHTAERIFEPFEQGDTSSTRRAEGTGLGLAISKSLVELMGGEIGFESEPGAGSVFWFTLPIAGEIRIGFCQRNVS